MMNSTTAPVKSSMIILALLLAIVGLFAFFPPIEKAQSYVSLENYNNPDVSCRALLRDRPWYGRLNHWFLAWIVFIPAFIFLTLPQAAAWKRGVRTILAIIICYVFMNLAIHLQWDMRNAPFGQDPFGSVSENGWRMDCVNTADGFSLVFGILFGWIPACVYTGICLCGWRYYHQKISGKIAVDYKSDIVTRILFTGLTAYSIATVFFLAAIAVHKAGLFNMGAVGWLYPFTLRPLIIPFEIFGYEGLHALIRL